MSDPILTMALASDRMRDEESARTMARMNELEAEVARLREENGHHRSNLFVVGHDNELLRKKLAKCEAIADELAEKGGEVLASLALLHTRIQPTHEYDDKALRIRYGRALGEWRAALAKHAEAKK